MLFDKTQTLSIDSIPFEMFGPRQFWPSLHRGIIISICLWGRYFLTTYPLRKYQKRTQQPQFPKSFSRSNHHHYSQIPLFELEPFPIFLLQWNFWFESQTTLSVILYQVFLSNSNYYIKNSDKKMAMIYMVKTIFKESVLLSIPYQIFHS